jgi:hypothetical protein
MSWSVQQESEIAFGGHLSDPNQGGVPGSVPYLDLQRKVIEFQEAYSR